MSWSRGLCRNRLGNHNRCLFQRDFACSVLPLSFTEKPLYRSKYLANKAPECPNDGLALINMLWPLNVDSTIMSGSRASPPAIVREMGDSAIGVPFTTRGLLSAQRTDGRGDKVMPPKAYFGTFRSSGCRILTKVPRMLLDPVGQLVQILCRDAEVLQGRPDVAVVSPHDRLNVGDQVFRLIHS